MNFKEKFKKDLKSVKDFNREHGLPARNEDIAKVLGYTRTHLSTLLGEHANVTEDHVKLLRLSFTNVFENQTSSISTKKELIQGSNMDAITYESIRDLAHSSVVLADANKALALNNHGLIEVIKKIVGVNSGGVRETQPEQTSWQELIEKVASAGVGELWPSKDAGLLKLGKLIVGDHSEKKE